MLTRRKFVGVLAGLIAAPIVVRSGILMPVRPLIVAPSMMLEYSGDGVNWHQGGAFTGTNDWATVDAMRLDDYRYWRVKTAPRSTSLILGDNGFVLADMDALRKADTAALLGV